MRQLKKVRINLHPTQIKSLSSNSSVIIKPDQVRDDGEHELDLSVVKHRRLLRNAGKNKGYRLSLDETEGGSFLQRVGLSLSKNLHPKKISHDTRDLWKAGKKSKLMRSPPPMIPEDLPAVQPYQQQLQQFQHRNEFQHTIGAGLELPFSKENLIRASEPLVNVGEIYFDHSRFIRPNQPAFKIHRVSAIPSVGSWV